MDVELQTSIFDEVAEFIASEPSLEAIRDYRVAPIYQQQVDELLEKIGKSDWILRSAKSWIRFWQSLI